MIFQTRSLLLVACCSLTTLGCENAEKKPHLLTAGREAPLGWVLLYLLPDDKFELHNAGIRAGSGHVFTGSYHVQDSLLRLQFHDTVPAQGCSEAIIAERFIKFDGCLGSLEIWKNEIK